MAGKARQNRDELETRLIGCHQSLLELCGAIPVQKRAVTRKLGEMEAVWDKLIKSHSLHCKSAGISLGSQESSEFLRDKERVREEAIQAAETVLGEDQEDDSAVKEKRMKKVIDKLKSEVEFAIPTLTDLSTDQLTVEAHQEAMSMVQEAKDKLNRYEELSGEAEELLDDTAAAALAKSTSDSFKIHGTKLMELRGLFLKKSPVNSTPEPKFSVGQAQPGSHVRAGGGERKQPVKIKPLDCPTWDGKFRSFARFKLLWDENITPRHEDSALHYMLCQSLPKYILDNISTLTSSADDIWAYLEEKYGKPEVVAREIMGEMMGLDSKKLGSRFMGKFCTTLLDTHSLLVSLGEEDWLTTNKTVSELENMLPRDEKCKWAELCGTVAGETKFERFRNFLQSRKKVMEVLDSMGGMSVGGSSQCSYCQKPGHTEDSCFAKQRAQGGSGQGVSGQGSAGQGGRKNKDGCAICGSSGHWWKDCPDKGTEKDKKFSGGKGSKTNSTRGRGIQSGGHGGSPDGDGGTVSAGVGSNTLRPLECPRCKYSAKLTSCAGCKKTTNINHCLLHCPSFNLLSVVDKVNVVKSSKSCAICLHPSHTSDRCDFRSQDKNICGMDGCVSHHHPCLHGSKDIYVTGVNVLLLQQVQAVAADAPTGCVPVGDWFDRQQYVLDSFAVSKTQREIELDEVRAEMAKPLIHGDKVLMTVMSLSVVYGIEGKGSKIIGFFDDGSNCSVIRTCLAEELGLWGDEVTLELGTVNATTTIKTKLYCVELLDKNGGRHLIRAFGLESLSGPLPAVNLEAIKGEFSAVAQLNWDKLARPAGQQIDLLIGSEVAQLHPVQEETVGRMVVKSSIFGDGWVLNGAHQDLECGTVEFDRNIQIIRSGCFRSNKIFIKYTQEVNFESVEELSYLKSEKDFMSGEDLGCEPPRRCIKCKGCQDCKFRGAYMSPKQALELEMMESRIKFDKNIGKWRVSYPFVKDPNLLKNNYKRVLKMAESLERRIAKAGLVDATNEVFNKMVANGAIKEISQAELRMWVGPEHYLPIQVVEHPSSMTTPVRLVTNSSLIDPETGLSFNGILAQGPMVLNDMWNMFVRFRHQECGLSADISKAYYQMLTGLIEKHCRRVLWRSGEVGTPWKIYGFEVVSMGDICASCFMELTKRATAEMSKEIDEVAAKKIAEDSFVDDVSTGGTKAECDRFKGTMDPDSCLCDGTIPQILGSGGFQVKAIAVSGEPDGLALEKLGGAVLGLEFSTASDMLSVKFKVNISTMKNGKPTGPDLTVNTLDQLQVAIITKRLCLRVTSSQYDPLGVAAPISIILRVHMRELYSLAVDWDQPLESEVRNTWVNLFRMLVEAGGIRFARSTKPVGAVGKCVLVCYFDGSDVAYAMVVYARWNMEDGTVVVNFVASKSKMAPMYATSTPRMEMNGATLMTRVVLRVVLSLLEDPPGQVYFMGDSETILASRERESGFFGEFFGNRIGEQCDNQESLEKIVRVGLAGEWYHIPSEYNAADKATRLNTVPADLCIGSDWLCGPVYLKLPAEQWPMNRKFADRKSKFKVPVEEVKRKFRSKVDTAGEVLNMGGATHAMVGAVTAGGPGCDENYVLDHFDHGWKTNNWEKLVKVTSSLFYWLAKERSDGVKSVELVARDMAVTFWLRVAMPATNKAAMEGKLKHITPFQHEKYPDMLVVVGRAVSGFQ